MGHSGRIKQRSSTDIFGPKFNGHRIGRGREGDSERNKA
jgi:hypothetical protein